MKYKITGISSSIEIDLNVQQMMINHKTYDFDNVLYVSFQQATTHHKGNLFILLDDFQTCKIEYIFLEYLDVNKTASFIYEKIKPEKEKIKAYMFARYHGGNECILNKGLVLIVLFDREIVIRKDEEEYRTTYDDIMSLSFSVDQSVSLENNHNAFYYFFYGAALGTILNTMPHDVVTKYQGILTIEAKKIGKITLYSPSMNELYHILYHLAHIEYKEKQINKTHEIFNYHVEYLETCHHKQDAKNLEILLNNHLKQGYRLNHIIDRDNDLLVVFSK